MIRIRLAGLRRLLVLAVATLLGSACLVALPATEASAATTITVNGTSAGRTFGGIGAISGGGGNSRLLTDYPAAQQQQILDYLFKPGYGADLQILKVEIGGDTNSTDGSESSIEHASGSINCNNGYEWWLMEQAKALNPNIKLYGLAWGAPGWIGGGNFWSTDMINYLVAWLNCAASHGLTINYLGGWNERGYNISWYEQLRSTLNADGYSGVQIVGADSDWTIANDIASNPTFASAVSIIGVHYPCQGGDGGNADTCPANSTAIGTGKPLWASENGSQDLNSGAPALIRSITRGYIDADLTAYINWPLVAAVYPDLPYNTDGLILANQPWSGAYSVGESLWATAQVTQFTAPGWQFLNSGSGYLGGSESNGSYVSLKSTDGTDYSTIIETTTATAAQTVNVSVSGGLSTGTVHVWSTDLNAPSTTNTFAQQASITPVNGSYSLTVQPGYIYTLTTTTGQGKGTAASPAQSTLGLPYTDSFDSDTAGQQPRYLSQQQGAFEVGPCAGGRSGQCVQQQAAVQPIEWDGNSNPYTIGGNLSWANYTVSADALMEQAGAVQLLGRAGTQHSFGAGRDQRVLPATVQYRRLVDRAEQHQRHADHPGQRQRRRAGHRHLAAPGADLQRPHDLGGDQRHDRGHGDRLRVRVRHGRLRHLRLPDRPVRQPVRHAGGFGHANRPDHRRGRHRRLRRRQRRVQRERHQDPDVGLQRQPQLAELDHGQQRHRPDQRKLPGHHRRELQQRHPDRGVDLQRRRQPAVAGGQRRTGQPGVG